MAAPLAHISKDPAAVKPYTINFKKFLEPGDTLDTVVWTFPVGLTKGSEAIVDGVKARVWVSGGTLGEIYDVVCHITTVGGLQDDVTLRFEMVDE